MRVLFVPLVLVLLFTAGCTSADLSASEADTPAADAPSTDVPASDPTSSQTSAPPPAEEPVVPTVSARDDAFVVKLEEFTVKPSWVEASVGDKVVWMNLDSSIHTVTSDLGGLFDVPLAPGEDFAYTFDTAGTYAFHCSKHDMHGTIRVS